MEWLTLGPKRTTQRSPHVEPRSAGRRSEASRPSSWDDYGEPTDHAGHAQAFLFGQIGERLLAKQFDRACDDADRGLALRLVALVERVPLLGDHAVLFDRQALKLVDVALDSRSRHVRAEVELDPD